jgi:hypothetical protein
LHDAVVDFNLQLVDGVFFVEYAVGKLLIGIEHGVNRLMNGALGETAHPQEAFFYFVEIFFEMAFHVLRPLSARKVHQYKDRQYGKRTQPKRPVMYASVRGSPGVVKSCGVGLNSMSWPIRRKAVKSLTRAACCML